MKLYLAYLRKVLETPVLLVIISLLCILGGIPAIRVQVNNNLEDWFPANSEQLQNKRQFIEYFGSDELMFLLLTFPDTASERYRDEILETLSDSISGLYGFEQVLSRHQLSNLPGAFGLKSRARKLDELFFEGNNAQVEMIYLKTRLMDKFDLYRPRLLDSLETITQQLPPDIQTDLTGSGVVFTEVEKISNQESGLLLSISFLVVCLLLGWRLKNLRKWGISLLVFLLLFWPAYSMFGWLKIAVNMVTMVVPILLLINFFAYILHLVNHNITDRRDFVEKKVPPIVFSAITTMIGFGSLMLNDIQIIRQFGILTFGGVLAGMLVLLFSGIPIILALQKQQDNTFPPSHNSEIRLFNRFVDRLTPGWSMGLFGVMVIALVGGIITFPRIEVDTYTLHFLPKNNPVRQASYYIEQEFGTFNTVDFLVVNQDNSPIDADDFAVLRDISREVEQLEFVDGMVSYNLWRPIQRIIAGVDEEIAAGIERNYLTEDQKKTRFSLRIPMGSVQEMKGYLDEVEAVIRAHTLETSLDIKAVGYLPIYIEHVDIIVNGLLRSLGFAVICITLTMMLMVGSWKLGLIALIPNTFPLGGLAMFMAFFGVPLDLGTSVIASVIIGLVVDDTLHIIWNYKKELRLSSEKEIDLKKVMKDILVPSTTTSIIFTLGFIILIISQARAVRDFGSLVSLAIVLGWIGDFLLFPAMLKILGRKGAER